jgi:hypothetical protein
MTSADAAVELSVEVPVKRASSLGRFLPWVAIGGPLPLLCCGAVLLFMGDPFQLHGDIDENAVLSFVVTLLAAPFAILVLPVSICSGVVVFLFGESWGLGTATRFTSATVAALTFAAVFAFLASMMS